MNIDLEYVISWCVFTWNQSTLVMSTTYHQTLAVVMSANKSSTRNVRSIYSNPNSTACIGSVEHP